MHCLTWPRISTTGLIVLLFTFLFPALLFASYFKPITTDGFGNSHNTGGLEVKTMAVFQDKLYVGVANKTEGAQVWCFDGMHWQQVNKSGFGSRDNMAIAAMTATKTALYASTASRACGEVWQYDGKDWVCLHSGAFGNTNIKTVNSMAVFKNRLYVGLWDQVTLKPAEVWAYDSTENWQLVNTPGFGSVHNLNVTGMLVSKVSGQERLYAIVWKSFKYTGPDAGCDIWAYDGKNWTKANAGREGFGEPGKGRAGIEPFSIAEFQGRLYVGLWSFGAGRGWEVWSYDGRDWQPGNSAIAGSETPLRLCIALTAHKDHLYAAVTDAAKDFELWSFDGSAWMNIIGTQSPLPAKLGSPDNIVINAMASYNNNLYLGIANNRTGYQVWKSSANEPPGNVSAARSAAATAYTVPEITAVSTMGRVYRIPILFDLKDPDGDTCSVAVEYQAQGGKWRPASIETVSNEAVISPAVNNPSQPNLISSLEALRPVNHYVCVWQSEKDIGESTGMFSIRLIPADSRSKGTAVVSKPFLVDNRTPPADEMVYVPAGKFYIDRFEYPNHAGYYPELSKTWYEARSACQSLGKDLCTIEQWELAYYGREKRRYPYGNDYGSRDRDFCNTQGAADEAPAPSGMYQNCVNDLGIYDMGGNVYEWAGLDEQKVYMADQSFRSDSMQQSMFNVDDPTHRHSYLGFRCCKPE